MRIATHSENPVYIIAGSDSSRQLPEWLARKRKKSLKQSPEYANRIELLQDFGFEEASQCIRVSEDGEWVMSTGTYKPQIHTHYLPHLSLSFSRHTDSLNQTFQLLSSDYSKSLHLQADRTLEFHTAGGRHYTTRIPRYGRDLQIDRRSAEALVPAVGVDADGYGEVYRLNLEHGRFMKSYAVDVGGDDTATVGGGSLQGSIGTGGVNTADAAEGSHNLLAFGTTLGTVEFWDPRSRSRVATLPSPVQQDPFASTDDIPNPADPLGPSFSSRPEITAVRFHPNGLSFASGTSTGLIHLYDLRSPQPLLKKDQGYDFPIQTLKFLTSPTSSSRTAHLSSDPKVLSADKRVIKIWDAATGSPWTSVEPSVDLHCVEWVPDSGMIMTANEGQQQHAFFIPRLGPAPRWCSFLDNLVEEMAEDSSDPAAFSAGGLHKPGEVYDNYKFLSVPQLRQLNLEHLIGTTGLLRPYMHGYFVAQQLYEEARLISQPDLWQEQRQKSIRERIEKERESRIRGNKKQAVKVKVNKALAQKLIDREEANEKRKAKRAIDKGQEQLDAEKNKDLVDVDGDADMNGEEHADDQDEDEGEKKTGPQLLNDPRFSALFTNEDFEVDETSPTYKIMNPAGAAMSSMAAQNGNEPQKDPRKRLTAVEQEELSDGRGKSSDSDEDSDDDDEDLADQRSQRKDSKSESNRIGKSSYDKKNTNGRRQEPRMEVKSSYNGRNVQAKNDRNRSFGSRAAGISTRDPGARSGGKGAAGQDRVVGNREVTFTPAGSKKHKTGGRQPDENGRASSGRGPKDRRSASGNVFRRM